MKVQINSRFEVDIDNISKIQRQGDKALVYIKNGYPKRLKSSCSYDYMLMLLINFKKYF